MQCAKGLLASLALVVTLFFAAPPGVAGDFESASEVAQAPELAHGVVTVSGHIVHLGDLFLNTGEKASNPVAYAPRPGKRAIFDARWLYRTARAHRLAWRPLSRNARVTVERESIVLTRGDVEALITSALDDEGIDTAATEVEILNSAFRLHLAAESLTEPVIEDLAVDERRGRFAAVLAMAGGDQRQRRVRITGRLYTTTEVPVLRRQVGRGDLIRASDIQWVKRRSRSLQKETLLAADDLVGMTPRRLLRPQQPVRASDVHPPIVVRKGELVTIVLAAPGMMLTARGRALQDGGKGETIRVSNTQSSLVVDAAVAGAGEVIVEHLAGAY